MNANTRYKVAMVGATGAVGETLLAILAERRFPVGELVALASERSAGGTVEFGGRSVTVRNLADHNFDGVDIAFFSAGGAVSRVHAPRAAAAGAVVIDNTSEFRYEDDVPLVVAEVNPQAIAQYTTRGIIANPNCSTMGMLVALAPIHREAGIERINVATYQ
uniref:aspartate-semialdehyde dehydrogenase n=1 Tax=Dokdonella sp. TaxID=2291710 RepID=UPI0027BAEBC1